MYYLNSLPEEYSNYFLQNKYTKWYFNIISNATKRNTSQTEYHENHHILPKCKSMFPQYISFTKNPWNKAALTAREHYICHLLLIKMTTGKPKASMYTAFNRMNSSNTSKYKSTHYELFRKSFSNSMIGKSNPNYGNSYKWTEEQKSKQSQKFKGRQQHPNTRKALDDMLLNNHPFIGKTRSKETKMKISQSLVGIPKPTVSISMKGNQHRKGKPAWNKGLKMK